MGEIRSGEFPFLASLCGDVVEQAIVSWAALARVGETS
jgi:hypothetical protein